MIKSSPHAVTLRQPHPRWHFNYANSQGVCGGHQPCVSQGGNSLWCLNISVLDGGIVLIDCVTPIHDHVRLGRTSYVRAPCTRQNVCVCVLSTEAWSLYINWPRLLEEVVSITDSWCLASVWAHRLRQHWLRRINTVICICWYLRVNDVIELYWSYISW